MLSIILSVTTCKAPSILEIESQITEPKEKLMNISCTVGDEADGKLEMIGDNEGDLVGFTEGLELGEKL